MSSQLTFSIVIASFNKLDYLRVCLAALERIDFPKADFEVVVVNDGSTDDTRASLDGYRAGYTLKTVHSENHGLAAARNLGISMASGRLLVMLDNDCLPSPDCLTQLLKAAEARPGCMYISAIEYIDVAQVPALIERTDTGEEIFPVAKELLVPSEHESQLPRLLKRVKEQFDSLTAGWIGAQGPSVCMEAELFERLGGYDSGIRTYSMEDFDLAFRFMLLGGSQHYVPESVIYHMDHGHPLGSLFRESTASAQYFYKKHRDQPEMKDCLRFLLGHITYLELNNVAARARGRAECHDPELDAHFSIYRYVDRRDVQMHQQRDAKAERSQKVSRGFAIRLLISQIQNAFKADGIERLPSSEDLPGSRIVVLAPHMDDEVIGAGGAIQKYASQGCEVTVVFITTGSGAPKNPDGTEVVSIVRERIAESRRAVEMLGATAIRYLDLPERKVASCLESDKLLSALEDLQCDVILTVGPEELHPDHRATWKWLSEALPRLSYTPEVFLYEVWGSCRPDRLLVLDEAEWKAKQAALSVYRTQVAQLDYGSVMEFLADQRGRRLQTTFEGAKAEAFRRLA